MYNEEFILGNVESAVVETPSKEERIKYAYLLMGYHESICSLSTILDYKSEPIQTLVGLVYNLIHALKSLYVDSDTEFTPKEFAKEHIRVLHFEKSNLMESYEKDAFEFLVNSVKYFGENA